MPSGDFRPPSAEWQQGYDAGYREAQQDVAAARAPSPDAPAACGMCERSADHKSHLPGPFYHHTFEAPDPEACQSCGRPYADEAEAFCGWCGAKAGVAPSPETPGLREAIEALPRLRITGEQLDAIDPDPEKVFYTDWDEWDEYVRLDALRAALASPPAPAGLDVDHPDCGDRCACYLRGWTVVNDEWEAAR